MRESRGWGTLLTLDPLGLALVVATLLALDPLELALVVVTLLDPRAGVESDLGHIAW